jgi:aminoglycoside phosphotransferase (APT) family kinase protein
MELGEVLGELAGGPVTDLAPLAGGSSRELWGFTAGGRRLVLRRDPAGDERPERLARELEVLRACHRHGVPVPEPLFSVPAEAGGGLVMERVDGEAIPRRILRDERFADARGRLVGQLAAAAAALHAVPVDDLPGLERPAGPAALAALDGLEVELDRLGEPHPALELGLRWLRAEPPPEHPSALVHGDFRLGNVIVDEAGLVAVVDWELAHLGDPVEDLGWLCARAWRFGNDDRPVAGLGTRAELLAAYGAPVDAHALRWWEACANVRWGVFCLMQADVHLSGRRRSLEQAAIGRRACEPEWDLLAMVG